MDQQRDGRRQPANGPSVENWLVGTRRAASNLQGQMDAVSRGAEDAFTFGLADRLRAGENALADAIVGKDFGQAYQQRMADEHAVDRYDDLYHPWARTGGKVVGTGAQVVLVPEALVARGGITLARAAPLVSREIAAIAGAGGTAGVAGQAISDGVNNRRGSLGDYAGAFVGGAAGALAARSKLGVVAGATTGGATSLAQDILNGRIDQDLWRRVTESARAGAALGSIGGVAGRTWSNSLPRLTKGNRGFSKKQLGESIADLRTWARGELSKPPSYEKIPLSDGQKTIPDQRIVGGGTREAKFGDWSKPKNGQITALDELQNHLLYRARPRDVGAAAGAAASALGTPHRE